MQQWWQYSGGGGDGSGEAKGGGGGMVTMVRMCFFKTKNEISIFFCFDNKCKNVLKLS